MPLYEYQCEKCGNRFEKIQKFSDPLETTCPKCGGVVHKLASSPAIQFKGSGFYITDYAKKDYVASAKSDSGSSGEKSGAEKPAKSDKSEKSEKAEKSDKAGKSASDSSASAPAATPASTTSDSSKT